MNELFQTLLTSDAGGDVNNIALLVFRVLLGFELFRVHGMKKFRMANGAKEDVPNPLHLPPQLNQIVAVYSDTVVPFLLMAGVLTRLVILPTIGVTAIGYFVIHRNSAPEIKDVPFMYSLCFLFVLVVGPGTYSIDHWLLNKI